MLKDGARSRYLGLILRSAITVGALVCVVRFVPLDEVTQALASASLLLMLAGLAAQVVLRPLNAARIRIVARAQGAPLTFTAILATLYTTAFYGLLLPGSVGGGAATLVKYVGHGATLPAALVSMIINRVFDTCTTVCVGLFFWGLDHRASGLAAQVHLVYSLLWLAPLLLLVFHLAAFGRVRLLQRTARALRRWTSGRQGALARGIDRCIEQLEAAGSLRTSAALAAGCLSLAKEFLAIAAVWCFARACGVDLSYVTIAWMHAVITLLVLLPVTLSGLGVREGALVLMSARYGIAAPLALTWSLLLLAGQVAMAAIGGLLEARTLWRREARV